MFVMTSGMTDIQCSNENAETGLKLTVYGVVWIAFIEMLLILVYVVLPFVSDVIVNAKLHLFLHSLFRHHKKIQRTPDWCRCQRTFHAKIQYKPHNCANAGQTKPTKETFHALKNYLDVRFKAKRIRGVHGYLGVKLKTVEYNKMLVSNLAEASSLSLNPNAETFLFERCQFSDCGKILNSVLLKEYQKWKQSVGLELTETDMKDLNAYLNASPHALKATVWTEHGNNEGYYGVSLRQYYYTMTNAVTNNPICTSTTGKKVEKREATTHQLLGTWPTIAKAALVEGMCAAKMSRCIKGKTVLNDCYYHLA